MKLIRTSNYMEKESQSWRRGKVFTKAPGFGPGRELEEERIITIRPEEGEFQALKREGFDPKNSRVQIINF